MKCHDTAEQRRPRLLDVGDCQWSGGFGIEGVNSFHVTVRDGQGRGTFIRVEIEMLGATYAVIITDAGNFPPPFRIDNFSEVSITYYQTGVQGWMGSSVEFV